MTAAQAWLLVALAAIVTAIIKGAGPVALGGRELPAWTTRVIALLAPALLAALVITAAFAHGKDLQVSESTAGVAAAGIVFWRGGSVLLGVLVAAVVTAGLRAL